MEQNKKPEQPVTFTRSELEAQGYANPTSHPAVKNAEAGQAPASTIEVRDESTGPASITVTARDITEGVKLAAANLKLAAERYTIDGSTGGVMLPSEIASGDRGVESVRR